MENTDQRYERARKRVEEEKGFYGHLSVYVIVIGALFVLNQLTGKHQWWFWPAFGWGIGIAAHGLGVFGVSRIFGKRWEERRIRKLMEEDNEL